MEVKALFEKFTEKRILVLGDVMIDAYLRGSVSRISPEAPVPIINLEKQEERLGGAANVALNLLSLGAEPIICTIIGEDRGGDSFMELLQKRGLNSSAVKQLSNRKTTIKTRVIGNNQHLIRIDEEETASINSVQEEVLINTVKTAIESGVDAMIMEDYNKGLLTENVIKSVIEIANKNNVAITVDPKKDNFFAYQNVTLFKPNLKELKEGLNVEFNLDDFDNTKAEFENAIDLLESKLSNAISFVTLSEYGVFINSKEASKTYIPAHIRKISDVSGAGDTVISVATLCLTAGLEIKDIAAIANLAGGLVCEMSGVVPIDKGQLMEEVLKLK